MRGATCSCVCTASKRHSPCARCSSAELPLTYHCTLQVRVKMVTSDDEMTTDVTFEGDQEEIERLRKVSFS